MDKIKVLLVDDQTLFVESLRTVLQTLAKDILVVAVAYDGPRALQLVAEKHPDVVLMDVRMPGMNGVETTKLIKERFPEIQVLMLTTFNDDDYVVEALKLEAVGYLLKDTPPAKLITAIRAVHDGGVLISQKVAAKVVTKLANTPEKDQDDETETSTAVFELSSREKEVLRLLAQGFENGEIASKLYIAEQTVKNHISNIYSKLGVHDRLQAYRKAKEIGIG
ncbi:MAG TPA: response regulator transcription factor [Bacillota bacterium]